MKRKLMTVVRRWKEEGCSRPLLIKGVRRCGKTYLAEEAGGSLFDDDWVKLDFQTDLARMDAVFVGPTSDVEGILRRISDYAGRAVTPATLLIFDEVQLSERALNSLRFFSGTGQPIIATGSLFGMTLKRRELPFPSGVQQEELHPLDFEEFLWAYDQCPMAEAIREHARSLEPYVLHDRALELFDRWTVVGGMPRPVLASLGNQGFEPVREEQREIADTYVSDMTDPENGISGAAALRVWKSAPQQLVRSSTKKFKYADVERGGRRSRLLEPLEWLEAAGIVSQQNLTHDTSAPLTPAGDEDGSFFKVFVADTGIMFHQFGIGAETYLDPNVRPLLSADFRGGLAENATMQAFEANGIETFYWTPGQSGGSGELDFVYQDRLARVVPVEVKSGRNVGARTLKRFMTEARSPYAVRLSTKQFGRSVDEKTGMELRSLPLYAAFCLGTDAV